MKKVTFFIGILFIFIAFLANPFVIAEVFTADGSIEKTMDIAKIFGFELVLLTAGLAFYFKSKSEEIEKIKEFYINLLVLVIAIFISLFMLVIVDYFLARQEENTQWLLNPNTEFNSDIGWSVISDSSTVGYGNKTVSSNSYGYRAPEVDINKEHILILGDSVAMGYGVSDDETSSYYLNNFFNDIDEEVQVLNLGVSAYGIGQYYLRLKKEVDKLNPSHIVVIIYTGNDFQDTSRNHNSGKSKPLFVLENDRLVNVNENISRYSCSNILSTSRILNNFSVYKKMRKLICDEVELNETETNEVISRLLSEMQSLAEKNSAGLTFFLSPHFDDYKRDPVQYNYFKDLLVSSEYSFIDFYSIVLEENKDPIELYLYDDPAHYNSNGNEYVAKTIFEYFQRDNTE